jgi:hypothetical protein
LKNKNGVLTVYQDLPMRILTRIKVKSVALKWFILTMTCVLSALAQNGIDMLIMDYPHGEHRIHVKRTGEAYLYYGAKPSAK